MVRFGSLFLGVTWMISVLLCTAAFAQEGEWVPENQRVVTVDPTVAPKSLGGTPENIVTQKSSDSDEDPFGVVDKKRTSGNDIVKGHGFQLGATFLGIPDGILDKWFISHGSMWDDTVNMGMSFDYFLRFQAPCEMRFSLSWVNLRTKDAYWLTDEYADRPSLADYVVNNYHAVALEVAAYHVISIIDEIAFYYGGGGWAGFILGDSWSYAIRSSCAKEVTDLGQCPHEPGKVPMTGIPDFFGFVVVTLGFKFTLLDMLTIRAEGGFKGYFYGQLGLGIEF